MLIEKYIPIIAFKYKGEIVPFWDIRIKRGENRSCLIDYEYLPPIEAVFNLKTKQIRKLVK